MYKLNALAFVLPIAITIYKKYKYKTQMFTNADYEKTKYFLFTTKIIKPVAISQSTKRQPS